MQLGGLRCDWVEDLVGGEARLVGATGVPDKGEAVCDDIKAILVPAADQGLSRAASRATSLRSLHGDTDNQLLRACSWPRMSHHAELSILCTHLLGQYSVISPQTPKGWPGLSALTDSRIMRALMRRHKLRRECVGKDVNMQQVQLCTCATPMLPRWATRTPGCHGRKRPRGTQTAGAESGGSTARSAPAGNQGDGRLHGGPQAHRRSGHLCTMT